MPENYLKSKFPKSLTSSRYEDLKAHQTRPHRGSDLIRETRPHRGSDLIRETRPHRGSDLIRENPSKDNASQSSPKTDTIESLKPINTNSVCSTKTTIKYSRHHLIYFITYQEANL